MANRESQSLNRESVSRPESLIESLSGSLVARGGLGIWIRIGIAISDPGFRMRDSRLAIPA